jgi:hypothetical protein
LSIEAFRRVLWIVLDGASHREVDACLRTGRFPALSRIAAEGFLAPCRPSGPVCQTPPALTTLFTGTQPRSHGVWGYRQPDFSRNPFATVSGFSVRSSARTVWEEAGRRGAGCALMNVAFRKDPGWAGSLEGLDFAYDAYRLSRGFRQYRLAPGASVHTFQGITFSAVRKGNEVSLRKGSRTISRLAPGEMAPVRFTPDSRAIGHLLEPRTLRLHAETPVEMRLLCPATSAPPASAGALWSVDMDAFRISRSLEERRPGDVALDAELAPALESARRKSDLMLWAARSLPSRLLIGYFPLLDEINHAYADLLEDELEGRKEPGRASAVLLKGLGILDLMLTRLMAEAGEDTLILVSSDHGIMPHTRLLAVNELMAGAGLVQRRGGGYDFHRSALFYHPSDCGQLLFNPMAARRLGLDRTAAVARALAALDRASAVHGVDAGVQHPAGGDPFALFLYPRSAAAFSGAAPGRPHAPVVRQKRGGHHLSSLSPSPWIEALCGVWTRRGAGLAVQPPGENAGVKDFVLSCLGLA